MESITIAIPAYNEEKYLPGCLLSIRKQDFKGEFELLVIDNNSKDFTARIARKFGARVVKEPKKGMLFAKHRSFIESSGDIVATTDADCILPVNWLSKIIAPFIDGQVVVTTGLVAYPKDTLVKLNYPLFDQIAQKSVNRFFSPFTMRGPNRAIRKNVYLLSGGIDLQGTGIEDEYLLLKKLKKYGKAVFLPDLIVQISDRRQKNREASYLLKDLFWKHLINGYFHHLSQRPASITITDHR